MQSQNIEDTEPEYRRYKTKIQKIGTELWMLSINKDSEDIYCMLQSEVGNVLTLVRAVICKTNADTCKRTQNRENTEPEDIKYRILHMRGEDK